MNLTVLNDWHIGCIRTGGTTPATAYQLRQDLLGQLVHTLDGITTDLLFNGDLFDGPDIPKADLLRTYQALWNWLEQNPTAHLYLSNGNHDLSKSSVVLSSFQLLAKLLISSFEARVTHIEIGQPICGGRAYVIPHVANQELFNVEMARVPECDYLFLHANYDNGFAVESDHSLNVSVEQALESKADYLVFGHEHQARAELDGRVIVVGNQVPSSVSDCLNNDFKRMFTISEGGYGFPMSWQAAGDYIEVDWSSLRQGGITADLVIERFVRVTGTATAAEAASVVQTIARFRQQSKALVITNAVKVEGVNDQAELELTHEAITTFNVHGALAKLLTAEENEKINNLLNPPKESHVAEN